MIPTWAVIPTNGRNCVSECVDSLAGQVQGIVIVRNGKDDNGCSFSNVEVIRDSESDMNISRWWNIGIDVITAKKLGAWNTLIVNDDIVAPPHLVNKLSKEMRATKACLAYPNQHDSLGVLWRFAEPVNLFHRITGFCFMLRGESDMHLDESLAWWYGDDDLDWRCRVAGGSLLVPGCAVKHKYPNGSMLEHPELHEQAGWDRIRFLEKWGRTPW